MKRIVSLCILLSVLLLTACQTTTVDSPESEKTTTEVQQTEQTTELPGVEPEYSGEFFGLYLYKDEELLFDRAPKAYIDIYRWSQAYCPVAWAQILFREDDGFYVRMYCEEQNPRAEYTNFGDPVYNDSCLEFFCDYNPSQASGYYINTEMNANGAFLTYWAHGMGNYEQMAEKTSTLPTVNAFKDENGWGVILHVPVAMLSDLYPTVQWNIGSEIACNFYKCGSKCEIKHYGTWKEVLTKNPNFHTPEYFGKVVLTRTPL